MDRNISVPKVFMAEYVAHRGYYMAVRRYEISLRVLKNISRVSSLLCCEISLVGAFPCLPWRVPPLN